MSEMTTLYFANRNRFNPPKGEKELPVLNAITGTLVSFDTRPGNNSAGFWFVFRMKKDEDYINVYFSLDEIDEADLSQYAFLRDRTVTLRSNNEKPFIDLVDVESEGSIRAELLKGVAAGTIQKEDLPALLEFAKGNDELNEKWSLFKQEIDNEGLAKIKENIIRRTADEQEAIDREKAKLEQLQEIYQDVIEEKNAVLMEMNAALMLLQGDESLHGSHTSVSFGPGSNSLVRIDNGYNKLMDAFQKFKTMKGIYVICDDKIHRIHHAYLEERGRAFLLGSSSEYLKRKPEEVKKLVDRVIKTLYPNRF